MMGRKFICLIILAATFIMPLQAAANAYLAPGLDALFQAANTIPTVPTNDLNNSAKETRLCFFICLPWGMDSIALGIAKNTLERMTDSTIDWINGKDSPDGPRFITDPGEFFGGIADGVVGEFLESKEETAFLCSPFQRSVTASLALKYRGSSQQRPAFSCTYSEIEDNWKDFKNSFKKGGGWETWFTMTQNDGNNPYGAYLQASLEIDSRVAKAIGTQQTLLDWGSGFFSTAECLKRDKTGKCYKWGDVKTPGKTIEGLLEKQLGSSISQLELADEFDELIGALLGKLLDKTVFSWVGLSEGHASNRASGGSGGGGQSDQPSVVCIASKKRVSVGDSVTWSVTSNLGANATYRWSGQELNGATGSSVSVTYTVDGLKKASVTGRVTDDQGRFLREVSANCLDEILVSKYQPLTVTCGVEGGALSAKQPITIVWIAEVSGGSGNVSLIGWGGGPKPGIERGQFVEKRPGGITIFKKVISYNNQPVDTYYSSISLADTDPFVAPIVDQRCQGTIYLY